MWESAFVFLFLLVTVIIKKFSLHEIICGLAVWFTFMHAQVADRMQEQQSQMEKPTVECYKKSNYYFWIKEVLWITFFLMMKSYAALVGSVIFFFYPMWRKFYNKKIKKSNI